jgi:hypothetical protein
MKIKEKEEVENSIMKIKKKVFSEFCLKNKLDL